MVFQALRPQALTSRSWRSLPTGILILLDAAALASTRAAPRLQRFCGDSPARCMRPSPPAAAQDKRSQPRLRTARQRKVFGDKTGWRRRRSVPQQSNAWTSPTNSGVSQKDSTQHPTGAPLAEMVNPGMLLGHVRSSTGIRLDRKRRLLCLHADAGLLDDRPPFVDLGLLETRKAFRRLLLA
jgi:hypothetical protein